MPSPHWYVSGLFQRQGDVTEKVVDVPLTWTLHARAACLGPPRLACVKSISVSMSAMHLAALVLKATFGSEAHDGPTLEPRLGLTQADCGSGFVKP